MSESKPSTPSWLQSSSAAVISMERHSTNPIRSSSTASQSMSRRLRELNKNLRCIYEDQEVEYGPDVGEERIAERYRIATKLADDKIKMVFNAIRTSKQVDLCFLLDATGSMDTHIAGVKESINQIVDKLTKPISAAVRTVSFADQKIAEKIRIAVVAYRDFGDNPQFETFGFSESVDEFRNFCANLVAKGGGDTPEDVFGGIEKVLQMSWSDEKRTKVLFHICDAPCHGVKFHNNKDNLGDSHPNGDPNGRTHTELFRQIRERGIQYFFGKINDYTNTMIEEFTAVYGEDIVDFNVANVDKICESVVSAVSTSISTLTIQTRSTLTNKHRIPRSFVLDRHEPDWRKLPTVEATLISFKFPKSIQDIIDDTPLTRSNPQKCIIQIAPNPFAHGAERLAYYGRDLSKRDGDRKQNIVLKDYMYKGGKINSSRRFEITNQLQTIAAYLAEIFTSKVASVIKVQLKILFFKIMTVAVSDGCGGQRFYTSEVRNASNEKFLRFTNNASYKMMMSKVVELGIDPEYIDMLMAFSHWTHAVTNGYLMVVDLQGKIGTGYEGKPVVFLTDPAIHCRDRTRFGPMNLGEGGMASFLAHHSCNKFCKALKLPNPTTYHDLLRRFKDILF